MIIWYNYYMKILQINSVYDFGSTGKLVKLIHNELLNKNFDSYVIYGRNKNIVDDKIFFIGSKINFFIDVIKSLIFDTHGFNSVNMTRKMIKKIENIKPDIIHLHNLHGFYLNIEMLLNHLKENNYKVIHTLHDCFMFTGFCSYYDFNNCKSHLNGGVCNCKNIYPYRLFNLNSVKNYNLKNNLYKNLNVDIVVPSEWLANEIRNTFLNVKKTVVINNGIDVYDIEENESEFILAVSNVWNKRKGFDDVISLALKMPDKKFIMVGLTDREIKKLPSNIHGIKRVNYDELKKIYQSSKIFLNFTYEDNFPTVNLEALMAGCYIIGYKTGGSVESIKHYGCLIDKNNYEAAIDIINNFKYEFKESLKANQIAKELYSKQKMVDEYIKLYKESI